MLILCSNIRLPLVLGTALLIILCFKVRVFNEEFGFTVIRPSCSGCKQDQSQT